MSSDDTIDCPYCHKTNEVEFCYEGVEGPGEYDIECEFCGKEFLISVICSLSIEGFEGTKKEEES